MLEEACHWRWALGFQKPAAPSLFSMLCLVLVDQIQVVTCCSSTVPDRLLPRALPQWSWTLGLALVMVSYHIKGKNNQVTWLTPNNRNR